MIKGVISVPKKVITGAFNILFSFSDAVDFTVDNFSIQTLSGDRLGDPRDNLKGKGNHYVFQCYIPTGRCGRSRVVLDHPQVDDAAVDIEYDTVKVVNATWGTPLRSPQKTEIPVSFDCPLRHLRKRNFRLSQALPFQLYVVDEDYKLVIPKRIEGVLSVRVLGNVVKESGVEGYIAESVLEV